MGWSLICNYKSTFPCPRIHFSKPWSHAPITILCLFVAFPYHQLHFCSFPCYTPMHSCYTFSTAPLPSSWLGTSVTMLTNAWLRHVRLDMPTYCITYSTTPLKMYEKRLPGVSIYRHGARPYGMPFITRKEMLNGNQIIILYPNKETYLISNKATYLVSK